MNIIKCKNCGADIEINEALTHQIEEEILAAERQRHQADIQTAVKKAEAFQAQQTAQKFELTIKELTAAGDEEKVRNRKLQEQILDLTREIRKIRQEKDDTKIEMEKKLVEEEEKIRTDLRTKLDEEHRLKDAEKEKKLTDMRREVEELKRKLEQGSQQTQGEVLELEIEAILKKEFPQDQVSEVKKGQRGADVIQKVIDKRGNACGIILWESKNAQWSETWLRKLREDQRDAKAHQAILVVANPPADIDSFTYRDGIWITTRKLITQVAFIIRYYLVRTYYDQLANVGKNEKMEMLFQYLTGTEFRNRIDSIVEAFTSMQQDIEREKRWFNSKWARQERELRKIVDNTYGLHGELQAVTGRQLKGIKPLLVTEKTDTNEHEDL
ncbi:hypothetical protein A2154_00410 [Candidatus Gottesmanbacteria bacterium RBG_16_43_7]|uniref:DUF2130 domain-containing protein n=1 Tax=Candidatus Gottesmanbacteria bacterium RBG_16_43_7 TaxID=1798373 RepID=A0A1F5Z8V3_9BACT|nr:MAG: hypothetical protein A2154_00410 [Candidatus Gottesmanbacteria bacterium RBG_16_43_7]